ncbi:hypothetical protein NFI96_032361 [Prochilodus magdalenae]|nr:hypothetical protein NFI96_032361 [Prochilodus magdalenae]
MTYKIEAATREQAADHEWSSVGLGSPLHVLERYWESSQPDDGGRESMEDCVITGTRLWKRWNDKLCQKSYYWICERGFPDVTEAD